MIYFKKKKIFFFFSFFYLMFFVIQGISMRFLPRKETFDSHFFLDVVTHYKSGCFILTTSVDNIESHATSAH